MERALLIFIHIATIMALEVALCGSVPLNRAAGRLSVVDWNNYNYRDQNGPGTYAFGYDIEDPETDNTQFRNEERHANGTVTGSYGYVDPDGTVHIVRYIADHLGYRAFIDSTKLKYLKPLLFPPISQLSENYPKEAARIVTPDSPNVETFNQLNNIGQNFVTPPYQNIQLFGGVNQPQPQFGSSGGFSKYPPPNSFNTYEPIWPNFDIQTLFNELKQPQRYYVKTNN